MRRSQRGNAVVFVLLAIALFAALAYTFMRGAKSGQGNLTSGQIKITAQDLINYSGNIEKAVDKLRQKGCSENEISFEGAYLPGGSPYSFSNPTAPSDNHCHIFNAAGGNITDQQFTSLMTTSSYPYSYTIYVHQNAVQDVGTAAPELLMIVPNLKLEACNAINNILSVTGPLAQGNFQITSFTGTYGPLATTIGATPAYINAGTIKGRTSFCMQHSYPFYTYVQVLLAR